MRILYLCQVNWEWILQRPQILALKLEKDHSCTVVSKKYIFGRKILQSNTVPKQLLKVYQFPKSNVFDLLRVVNSLIYNLVVRIASKKFDAIWICHPCLFNGIPKNYKGIIIYDCMDHHSAMSGTLNKKKVFDLEQKLISRSDVTFATSEKLKEVIPGLKNAILVRNGYQNSFLASKIKTAKIKNKYTIGYFGTISTWFDFELLEYSLNHNCQVEYRLIGPVDPGISKNINSGIIFEGIVEHEKLGEVVQEYDALIMPFELNEIILAVDPVKLYEYIYMGKCIISVRYPEIERFEPYVYFYNTKEDYKSLIEMLSRKGFPTKYNEEQKKIFLKENTWDARYEIILQNIEEYECE